MSKKDKKRPEEGRNGKHVWEKKKKKKRNVLKISGDLDQRIIGIKN